MIIQQHYLACLSQASYLIADESTGRAVVVDPRRDVSVYVDAATEVGAQIELIIETHLHADFLSGHLELAAATGAAIAYGSRATTEFESRKLDDGERISLGDVILEIRHTPGHTPESICIAVYEHADDESPRAVLTGDTLFVGDVGRPDLMTSVGFSSAHLAGDLYRSLHDKLLSLPDDVVVYPGHGAGSACGKALSGETWSTIGEQRDTNYAVRAPSRAAFIELVTSGQTSPPSYFAYDGHRNREARALLDETRPPAALPIDEVLRLQREGAVVLDTREPGAFARGHLAESVNVGMSGRFAEYVGTIIGPTTPVVLVTDPGEETEARNRLGRIGYDRVVGALVQPEQSMLRHPDAVVHSTRMTVEELRVRQDEIDSLVLLDVRQPGETDGGVMGDARLVPLTQLVERIGELDAAAPTVVYCASGFRSSIAASMLSRAGFADVSDLLGGYEAWATRSAAASEGAGKGGL